MDVSTHDKVIVAVPVEQAMEIASWLGLEIMGQSYSKIVSWGPTENKPQMVPEGYDFMQIDNTTSLVELSSDISDKLIDNSLEDITKNNLGKYGVYQPMDGSLTNGIQRHLSQALNQSYQRIVSHLLGMLLVWKLEHPVPL